MFVLNLLENTDLQAVHQVDGRQISLTEHNRTPRHGFTSLTLNQTIDISTIREKTR